MTNISIFRRDSQIPWIRAACYQAVCNHLWLERVNSSNAASAPLGVHAEDVDSCWVGRKKKKGKQGIKEDRLLPSSKNSDLDMSNTIGGTSSGNNESYTPESTANGRTRKHLRFWVRRLQCSKTYKAHQATLTCGKNLLWRAIPLTRMNGSIAAILPEENLWRMATKALLSSKSSN
jgi:hypothetical protein